MLIKLQFQNLAELQLQNLDQPLCSKSEKRLVLGPNVSSQICNKLLPTWSSLSTSATVTTSTSFELAFLHARARSLKSGLVLPTQIFGLFGPPKKRVNYDKSNQRQKCIFCVLTALYISKTLPKAQRTQGLSSSCQSHIASSNTNLDRISSSESWLSINKTSAYPLNLKFKILTQPSFRISTKIQLHNLCKTSATKCWTNSSFKILLNFNF